jgi:predicted SprT family Zn-dependent metalloprotease
MPGGRYGLFRAPRPAVIEIAEYLFEEEERHLRDTMAHEMIHYWLWVRRRPYGHTAEFLAKMRQIGATRYNPVPRLKPARYLYRCPQCAKDTAVRRRLGDVACLVCCRAHARGKYDARFRLMLVRDAKNPEAPS